MILLKANLAGALKPEDFDPVLQERLQIYTQIMNNIDQRLFFILTAPGAKNMGISKKALYELILLNVRKVTEFLSVACLAASGDLNSLPPIKKEFKAGLIFAHLRRNHKDYFPVPTHQDETLAALGIPEPVPPMDEASLISFYEQSHNYLHAGSLRGIRNWLNQETNEGLNEILYIEFALKMVSLIRRHRIVIGDGIYLHCGMSLITERMGYSIVTASPEIPDVYKEVENWPSLDSL